MVQNPLAGRKRKDARPGRTQEDSLRSSKRADDLSDLERELLEQLGLRVGLEVKLGLHGDKGVDGLAGELVRRSNDCRRRRRRVSSVFESVGSCWNVPAVSATPAWTISALSISAVESR